MNNILSIFIANPCNASDYVHDVWTSDRQEIRQDPQWHPPQEVVNASMANVEEAIAWDRCKGHPRCNPYDFPLEACIAMEIAVSTGLATCDAYDAGRLGLRSVGLSEGHIDYLADPAMKDVYDWWPGHDEYCE